MEPILDPLGNQFDFAKTNFGDEEKEDVITASIIHISTQQITARKKATVVRGIPDDISYPLVLKAWKKIFHCVGAIKNDSKTKENFITLNGDHKQEVFDFLIHEGIGTKENIKMHGA